MQKNIKKLVFILICTFVAVFFANIPYKHLMLENNILVTHDELNDINNKFNSFFVNNEIMRINADNEELEKQFQDYTVKFKLFNLFNIKNLKVKVSTDNIVYAGGNCVGISLKSKGVIVVGSNYIITKQGNVNPFKESGLQVGDVITHINDAEVNNIIDIGNYLTTYKSGKPLNINVIRQKEHINLLITPALDVQTNKYKLGLWIRDDAVGVGTLTFINADNNRFGSLGHAIIDSDTGVRFNVNGGNIYNCNIIGVKQGKRGVPGELMGLFMYGEQNQLGDVDKNSESGVYGYITNNKFVSGKQEYEIGGRLTAKPGKAKILACITGQEPQEYDIEIIKTNYQNKPNEKSMVIKITDKQLLEKTGGIVQGMSGSPIIQNGKIIGAVTHVFVNDPTKGFGLYLDWMLVQ